ncbi:MAG: hypothetical protein R3B95_20205 [Nitrospirales bacterium]|nr:hypothetical protein [Nitrospirales bacterium]
MRQRSKTKLEDRGERDTLTAVIRAGARKLIAQALETEVAELLAPYADQQEAQGRCRPQCPPSGTGDSDGDRASAGV